MRGRAQEGVLEGKRGDIPSPPKRGRRRNAWSETPVVALLQDKRNKVLLILNIQLLVHVLDVGLDRRWREYQLLRYEVLAAPLSEQDEHFRLAGRELVRIGKQLKGRAEVVLLFNLRAAVRRAFQHEKGHDGGAKGGEEHDEKLRAGEVEGEKPEGYSE